MTTNTEPRKRVGVLFGGRSAEHEISVITSLQLMEALDTERFEAVPVYIAHSGRWYTGAQLCDRAFYRGMPGALSSLQEVTLLPRPGIGGLTLVGECGIGTDLPSVLPIDLFVFGFHGQFGEDGAMQGLMELADFPYTGCGVTASALAMDKYLCKCVLKTHGIPVLPAIRLTRSEAQQDFEGLLNRIIETPGFSFPLFVKPNQLGSSIGVGKADDRASLAARLAGAFAVDGAVLIEPCVTKLLEVNVSVLDAGEPVASVVETPVSDSGVLTYEEKYMRGGGKKGGKAASSSQGMASLTRVIDPPDLAAEIKDQIRSYALLAFQALGCSGVVRFDFMIDLANGKIYFNELNPIPGSLSFYLWVKSSPQRLYTEVLNSVIDAALRRHELNSSLKRDMGFRALK